MEGMPVEIIGAILSCVSAARDVVLASATCRKWRRAFRDHLRVLSFRVEDWSGFEDLPYSEKENLVSRTILQTANLRSLIIGGGDRELSFGRFSVSAVMSWLLHTGKSLHEFHTNAYTETPLNIVEICVCEKLEKLTVIDGVIEGVNPDRHRFPSLTWLSLGRSVRIPEHNLSALLSVCPNLESLDVDRALISVDDGPFEDLKMVAPNMRRFSAYMLKRNAIIFESDSLEHLDLNIAHIDLFKFVGKGTLKSMKLKHADFRGLEICGSAQSLESVQVLESKIPLSELYRFIIKSSKLQKLMFWDVFCSEAMDLETIAIHCPQLSSLAFGFGYYLHQDDTFMFPYSLGGSTRFEHVLYLEVGWSYYLMEKFLDEFFDFIEDLLERCPILRQLVINGMEDLRDRPRFSTPIYRILGKCVDLNVQLAFHRRGPLRSWDIEL